MTDGYAGPLRFSNCPAAQPRPTPMRHISTARTVESLENIKRLLRTDGMVFVGFDLALALSYPWHRVGFSFPAQQDARKTHVGTTTPTHNRRR